MNAATIRSTNCQHSAISRAVLMMIYGVCAGTASATGLPIADGPVGVGVTSSTVKPNIAMVIDDSGSMDEIFMPDSISGNSGKRCFGFKGYNTMAYDPTYTYKPPFKPGGTTYTDGKPRYTDASFSAALYDGYFSVLSSTFDDTTNRTINLNSSKPFSSSDTGYYYSTYSGTSTGCDTSSKYTMITSASDIEAPGVVKGSAEAKTNYANWFSYYRKRAYTMKASTGEAFNALTDSYRVGLFFISETPTPEKIDDFTSTKRTNWYDKLYRSKMQGGTPLRRALSQMGRMYAGKLSSTYGDPVQYSCQQNFTILSTDGAWNSEGSLQLNGTSVIGDVDASAPRPFKDTKGASDTLADTAFYYYSNDLRTPELSNCSNTIDGVTYSGLCENNVLGTTRDNNTQQHMTTFTVGLGVNGSVLYESNYETAPDIKGKTQYFDILNGSADWPAPTSSAAAKIDDLWHAAVNGRGYYYSASNPTSLEQGIKSALAGVSARIGSSTAAATSNLEPVTGDNMVYLAKYRTVMWDGDLVAKTINPDTGVISADTSWTSQVALDTQVSSAASGDGRSIKFFSASATNKLKDFTFTNLTADSKGTQFTNACTDSVLSQCDALTSAQKTLANSGENMVNYLRGQSTYEAGPSSANPLFRDREHILGDVVNSVPVYVKKPQFDYDKFDTTYSSFKTSSSRGGTVYFGSNDGMLHAINADNGTERWAYIPSFVMPNMRKLADVNYSHLYFTDGSPTAADICISPTAASGTTGSVCSASTAWRTILVGGLNKGGCGYYALDVTDPTTPKGLWEFTHDNLGYSYGNPIVTRRKDGKWVVIISSGYNNIPGVCGKPSGTGDGKGHVFVLDAVTGALLTDITTNVGTPTDPSNLGKLNVWVDNASLNTAETVYGGDMLGNLWRIDFDDNHGASGTEAFLLATLKDASGTPQPISTKPELAFINSNRVVMAGTGKLLAVSDLGTTSTQSLYAIKDDLTASTGMGNPRSSDNAGVVKARTFVSGTNSSGRSIKTVTGDALNWATDKAWYVDFNTSKERLNVDMQLQYNILTLATNVPDSNACTAGGYGWLYYMDIETGKALPTSPDSTAGYRLSSNALVAGIKTVKLQNEKTVTIVTDTLGDSTAEAGYAPSGSGAGGARRTMWREIAE